MATKNERYDEMRAAASGSSMVAQGTTGKTIGPCPIRSGNRRVYWMPVEVNKLIERHGRPEVVFVEGMDLPYESAVSNFSLDRFG
jgi:hypothetical protein